MPNYFYQAVDNVVASVAVTMGDSDGLYIVEGVHVGSKANTAGVTGTANESLQIFGTLLSVGRDGYSASGGHNSVFVGATGAIMANLEIGRAIDLDDDGNTIQNAGTISGYLGINIGSTGLNGNSIENSGTISGSRGDGITVASTTEIHNTGVIQSAQGDAIAVLAGTAYITNAGEIHGGLEGWGIHLIGSGGYGITNTGKIIGGVYLGDGGGTFEGSEGRVTGGVSGGSGNDTILLGAGADYLSGGDGADFLSGGAGRDQFAYTFAHESTGTGFDTIDGFDARQDQILAHVTGVNASVTTGRLNDSTFNGDLKNAVPAGHLGQSHAVLFTPSTGDHAGETFLIVDRNGKAGYQVNQDFVIELTNAVNLDHLNVHSFG